MMSLTSILGGTRSLTSTLGDTSHKSWLISISSSIEALSVSLERWLGNGPWSPSLPRLPGLALARLREELRRAPSPELPMLPLPSEEPTVLCDDMLLSALRVWLLIERLALAEEVAFPPILICAQSKLLPLIELAYLGNPGQDDVGCGEVQYWWETSRLEVKFEKGTDNEQRARLSDAPLALRSDDLRVAAKAVAVDVGCGEVRSWCAVVMVDELGEEWTDEKLCRVTEEYQQSTKPNASKHGKLDHLAMANIGRRCTMEVAEKCNPDQNRSLVPILASAKAVDPAIIDDFGLEVERRSTPRNYTARWTPPFET
ncbi:hypothetical protein THAOC_28050 [Thalassiosira oceanica]|uniref:Uncharacterized protein n=1 Tax=Thalassiosira oceanica TaxID=159749 RepID=K0RK70_THAOC|nr:hypothetical protein THAOC_28050 [Thalassiosira oceanica]|eukprot:EJK52654.1 hypothetical protein THAOC_28050 [Thalassiosira oceanica]